MEEVLCAALSGIAARILCHPLDTVKTVSFAGFAGEQGHLRGFAAAAREVYRREGLPGFYRGVGVSCASAAPGVALYLSSYSYFRDTLVAASRSSASEAWRCPQSVIFFVSGLLAEAFSCVVWVPSDVAKERLQSQPPELQGRYRNSWDALRTIWSREGLRGLYKGYWSTLASFGPFSAIYFVCYEFFCATLATAAGGDRETRSPTVALLAGAGGNVMASLGTNPFELVKTRLQVQRAVLACPSSSPQPAKLYAYHYTGLVDGILTIAKTSGVRALWGGVGSRIAYTAPNAALTMCFFELFKETLIPSPTSASTV